MKRAARATIYAIAAIAISFGTPAAAQQTLHQADLRLLRMSERLQDANVGLCDRRAPALGAALQSRDQFPQGAPAGFGAEVAFGVVLPEGPAALAGIAEGDGLVAIDGENISRRGDLADNPLRDSAFAMLAEHPSETPLRLTIVRSGTERVLTLPYQPQCRALVEVVAESGTVARSDGRVIQLSLGLVREIDDMQLAVIFAHELAHSVLRHRDRLESEGVNKGLAGEFGRDRQLNAEAEIEADRLSVHLLANAGLDPHAAAAFWRSPIGRSIGGGLFRSRIYSSPEERAITLEREISDYLAGGAPSWPGHLLARRRY